MGTAALHRRRLDSSSSRVFVYFFILNGSSPGHRSPGHVVLLGMNIMEMIIYTRKK